jgi:epsilon-lactone hydrolase
MTRDELDALLRQEATDRNPDPTVEEERDGFAESITRPLPDEVVGRPDRLGERPALTLELEAPRRPGRMLYLHGGGFVIGSARTHAGLAAALAGRVGLNASVLDYRLAPEHPFPAAVDDGLAAYRALLESGTDAHRLVLAGDSAGGGLVLSTLLAARAAGLPQPAAAAVFSPWVDLTLAGDSMRTKIGIDPIFTREPFERYLERYLAGQDPTQPLASPVLTDLRGLAPLLIQVGANELLLDDAVRLAGRAAADDVDVTLQVWGRLPHVFQLMYGRLAEADVALDQAGRFLAERLDA